MSRKTRLRKLPQVFTSLPQRIACERVRLVTNSASGATSVHSKKQTDRRKSMLRVFVAHSEEDLSHVL